MNPEREIVVRIPDHLVASGDFQLDISINLKNIAARETTKKGADHDSPVVQQIQGPPNRQQVNTRPKSTFIRSLRSHPYHFPSEPSHSSEASEPVTDQSFKETPDSSVCFTGEKATKNPEPPLTLPNFPNSILGTVGGEPMGIPATTYPNGKFTPRGLKVLMDSIDSGTPAMDIFPLFPNISKSAFRMRYSRLKHQKSGSGSA